MTDRPLGASAARADTTPVEVDRGPATTSLRLREPGGLAWQGVEPQLRTARLIVLAAVALPLLIVAVVLAAVLHWIFWLVAALVLLLGALIGWVISRQVSAISWVELPDDIVIRRGRIMRSMVVIPYGRLQYVDVAAGPLARKFGFATVEIHTASPASAGSIPGLTVDVAEQLRERLSDRGESQRAGL